MGGIIGGVAAIAGGIMGSHTAKSAASTESNALQQGINYAQGNYQQAATNLQPFIGGGQSAENQLLNFYGLGSTAGQQGASAAFQNFLNTPTYQFAQQQGMLGLNRQLAAAGLSGSGAALKEGAQYTSGLASQGLQSYLSGLSGLATQGQGAATSLGNIGVNVGNTVSGLYGSQGLAQAGGITGSYNALQQGLQGLSAPLGSFTNGLFGVPQGTSSAYSTGTNVGNYISSLFGGGGGNTVGTSTVGGAPAGAIGDYTTLGLPTNSWGIGQSQ